MFLIRNGKLRILLFHVVLLKNSIAPSKSSEMPSDSTTKSFFRQRLIRAREYSETLLTPSPLYFSPSEIPKSLRGKNRLIEFQLEPENR